MPDAERQIEPEDRLESVLAMCEPITEEWLREIGFRWHQLERQPSKQWLLWLGSCMGKHISYEDFGLELSRSFSNDGDWHCWARADTSSLYSRFLHVRYLRTRGELIRLIEGVTGLDFDPANIITGSMLTPEHAASIRRNYQRLDQQFLRERRKWRDVEKDESRGRPLPEHVELYEKSKQHD